MNELNRLTKLDRKLPQFLVGPLLLLCLSLSGCTIVTVSQDYAQAYDFSGVKTFYWWQEKPQVLELTEQRIRAAAIAQLKARGYQQVESRDQADVWVRGRHLIETELEITSFDTWHAHRLFPFHPGIHDDWATRVEEYKTGIIVVDMIDPERKEIIWRGTAESTLQERLSPEQKQQKIDNAMAKLLDQFPPRQSPEKSPQQ